MSPGLARPSPSPDSFAFVDLSSLAPEEKATATAFMKEVGCNCGCSMTIAECGASDPTCPSWPRQVEALLRALKEGTRGQDLKAVVQAAFPPYPRREYPDVPYVDPPIQIAVDGAPTLGPLEAPVTIVAFVDLRCPVSTSATLWLKTLRQALPNDLRLVFRVVPGVGPGSRLAAEAALAAHAQGKYWPMANWLAAQEVEPSVTDILAGAKELGLDAERLADDLASGEGAGLRDAQLRISEAAVVDRPPVLFINGRRFHGLPTQKTLRPFVDAALKGAEPPGAPPLARAMVAGDDLDQRPRGTEGCAADSPR